MACEFLHSRGWAQHVDFFASGEHERLLERVAALRATGKNIYPPQQDILQAFAHTGWDEVRVLILGQDPYHGEGQAHGLAFSVPQGMRIPPSLRNILKEVARDMRESQGKGAAGLLADSGLPAVPVSPVTPVTSRVPVSPVTPVTPISPCLVPWAKQGVLLLNTVLSVEAGKAHSHARLGWQALSAAVVQALAARSEPLVALLWGNAAREYKKYFAAGLADGRHLVLCAAHPSPLSASRGFHACGHFSATNAWLRERGLREIDWLGCCGEGSACEGEGKGKAGGAVRQGGSEAGRQ